MFVVHMLTVLPNSYRYCESVVILLYNFSVSHTLINASGYIYLTLLIFPPSSIVRSINFLV